MSRELVDVFAETSDEEVQQTVKPGSIEEVLKTLNAIENVSNEEIERLKDLLGLMVDLFDTDLPKLVGDIQTELVQSSREINLSRFLREKAIVRVYMLTRTKDKDGIPLYTTVKHPDTGEFFETQEEIIGWWCSAAAVSRALIFQRLATYGRLENIGFSLEESYEIVKKKPSTITESLRILGRWDKTRLVEVPSMVAQNIMEEFPTGFSNDIDEVLKTNIQRQAAGELSDDEKEALAHDLKGPMRGLISDVAFMYERASDAVKQVAHGIAGKPEVRFKIDPYTHALIVSVASSFIDESGKKFEGNLIETHFLPDTHSGLAPDEVIEALVERLPLTNKADFL